LRGLLLALLLTSLVLLVCPVMAQDGEAVEHADTVEHAEEAEHDNVTAWKALNFGLLALVLGYFLRKPAKQYFSGRTAEIRQGIHEAAKLREEAEVRAAEMERRLANLETEIRELRASARDEMVAEEERLRAGTEQALSRLRERSQQEIASATRAARQQLRTEAAQLALGLARGIVRERMTPEVTAGLMTFFVDEVGNSARRNP